LEGFSYLFVEKELSQVAVDLHHALLKFINQPSFSRRLHLLRFGQTVPRTLHGRVKKGVDLKGERENMF